MSVGDPQDRPGPGHAPATRRTVRRFTALVLSILACSAVIYFCRPAGAPPPVAANNVPDSLFQLLRTQEISSEVFVGPTTRPAPNLFFLLKTQTTTDEVFVCPSSAAEKDTFGGGTNTGLNHFNFTTIRKNLSYSYANPFPNTSAHAVGYKLTNSLSPDFTLMADVNPGPATAATRPGR